MKNSSSTTTTTAVTETGDYRQEFAQVVDDTRNHFRAKQTYFYNLNLNESRTWVDEVKGWSNNKKIAFILWLVAEIQQYHAGERSWQSDDEVYQREVVREAYVNALFRNKLVMNDDDAARIYDAFHQDQQQNRGNYGQWPVAMMLKQLASQRKGQAVSAQVRQVLTAMKEDLDGRMYYYDAKDRQKLEAQIDGLLDSEGGAAAVRPARFQGYDALAKMANPAIEQMPEGPRQCWYRLLSLAQKATGGKPSRKYLEEVRSIIQELGAERFRSTVHDWFQFLIQLREQKELQTYILPDGQHYEYISTEYLSAVNAEVVRGFVWSCITASDQSTIQILAALAERAFRKIPGRGPTAASVGNACLYALAQSKGLEGIGQLSRLRLRIRQSNTQTLIDRYLSAAAAEQGVTIAEIEDMAVDDCGFAAGRLEAQLGDYKAELTIAGVGKTALAWYKPDGALQKSVPAQVKEKHADGLKKLKAQAKQAEQTLTAQRDRLDQMFRSGRVISREAFDRYYLAHGLMTYLAKGIIWNFHVAEGTATPAIWVDGCWVNEANEAVPVESSTGVSLWHPVQATVANIKAWRDFLVEHKLVQPLKQAFREVYLLTDAELNTRSYSNRMAAHMLRQHQFNSLAKARGWRYSLMGAYDDGRDNETAELTLPEHHLRAEYWVNEVNADGEWNPTGIWNYVSTDQVRFVNTTNNAVVDLVDVPSLVFSEVMRDVDLFVGVASVGNDPAWADSGGLPAYRNYWESYSFGDLTELAKSRKEILAGLVPRLKIRDVAEIREKFLVVRGKLRTYKIHIGSTNILMEPNDQYLCIVPDRSQKSHTDNLYLPFEGDNGLSVILSKAFLLADDDQITDPTITSQIKRA